MLSKIFVYILLVSCIYTFQNDNLAIKYHDENQVSIIPRNLNNHKKTIIWLHGLGDDANGFVDLFKDKALSPFDDFTKIRLLTAPTMPVTISGGLEMHSWFDLKDFDMNEKSYSFKDVENTTKFLNKILDEEVKHFNGDSLKVMIGGFSQGCAMALHAGLNYAKPLGGIIGLSGFKFKETEFPYKKIGNTPIFLSHGDKDVVFDHKIAHKSYSYNGFADKAKKMKWVLVKDLEHTVNGESMVAVRKFLKKLPI